jgi:hypothetical protein
VSRVTAVATAVEYLRNSANLPNWLSLGLLRSGWQDLNSRPLDPQIGGLIARATD